MISGKQGKVWGETACTFVIPGVVEVWTMDILPHSHCSKHRHNLKLNQFTVLDGELTISVWKRSYDLVDVTTLKAGDNMIVSAGEFHRFINKTDKPVKAVEIYWSEFDSADIDREDHGGVTDEPNENHSRILGFATGGDFMDIPMTSEGGV